MFGRGRRRPPQPPGRGGYPPQQQGGQWQSPQQGWQQPQQQGWQQPQQSRWQRYRQSGWNPNQPPYGQQGWNQRPNNQQGTPGVIMLVLLVIAIGIVYAFTKGIF